MKASPLRPVAPCLLLLLLAPAGASGQQPTDPGLVLSECRFTVTDAVMHLEESCLTDRSIVIPDGLTLDGHGRAIVAVDPPGESFGGGVVVARGGRAAVINTVVTVAGLRDACPRGAERLRGILFDGASGVIADNTIAGIHRGGGTCGGVGVEVRKSAAGEARAVVEIVGNRVDGYQKSGIVVHGHVDAFVYLNEIGASALPGIVTANALQIGPGAGARVSSNTIVATAGADDGAAGTGVLLWDAAPGTTVSRNQVIGGDVGIYVLSAGAIIEENDVIDAGPDGFFDVGIVNLGEDTVLGNNTVRGYATPYHGIEHARESPGGRQIE